MTPQEAIKHINKEVTVNNAKISGRYKFTAYIFRIINNKKIYQAEVQNINPPHEIYIVALDNISEVQDESKNFEM